MRYRDFAALCEREYTTCRGDVTRLDLTGPSAAELTNDIIASVDAWRPKTLRIPVDAVGARLTEAYNPITHTAVAINSSSSTDTATVSVPQPDGTFLPRTVAVA